MQPWVTMMSLAARLQPKSSDLRAIWRRSSSLPGGSTYWVSDRGLRRAIDEIVGIIRKQDLFDAQIDGRAIDLVGLAREPLAVHEGATILKVLEEFRQRMAQIAIVVDEYGDLEGLVTQTDLLAAIAGQLPAAPGEEADILVRPDGSFLIDGGAPVFDVFERLGLKRPDDDRDYHTIAGFALDVLGRIPQAGESFCYEGFRFEIVDMDGRRIDKLLVAREAKT